ncbi:CinA family protein [Ralstonia syzygii subsp. celebesensis]
MAESRALAQLAELVGDTLHKRSLMVATAESCTAGLVSAAITDISGASAWFERGFVTYSNEAKSQMLGVPATLIREHGAVSEPVAHAMAEGAVLNSRAQVALAVTGVAGPTGGTPTNPSAWCASAGATACRRGETRHFKGDRKQIRLQAAEHALRGLLDFLDAAES